MSRSDFIVPPITWRQIRDLAHKLRTCLDYLNKPKFPVMEVVEFTIPTLIPGFQLEIGNDLTMQGAEGYTDPDGKFIVLHEDVVRDAYAGDGRARFTVGHELGHLLLHTKLVLARVPPRLSVKPYRRSEPQANQFAAEILMPIEFFQPSDTEELVMFRHGTSVTAARNRLAYVRKHNMFPKR